MKQKILIVEDENSIRGFLKINFERNDYAVIDAASGEEGLQKALLEKPALAILDIMLPGIDGYKVCQTLRKELPGIGVIMLTARSQDLDKIMGLEHGADDYIVKPFNPAELLLRVKALLRRISANDKKQNNSTLESTPFKINLYEQKVYKNDCELDLTPKEYLIMKVLLENPGKAFTRDELLNLVWGYQFIGDPKIVDVNIRRLRAKIEDSSNPVYIETVWGTGYRWKNNSDR